MFSFHALKMRAKTRRRQEDNITRRQGADHGFSAPPHTHKSMIIHCEFTNASNLVREHVTFLTGMRIMVDGNSEMCGVAWDASADQPMASINKLRRAMHESGFRVHLDKDKFFMIMIKRIDVRQIIWLIGVDWTKSNQYERKLRLLQRSIRSWIVRGKINRERKFSRAQAANELLKVRLRGNHDVILIIINSFLSMPATGNSRGSQLAPNRPLYWVKPHSDGQILA
jgi:hypothetical protein